MIELLVVVAIIAVLAMIAAPSLTGFAQKSAMRGLASDFTGSMQRARAEAISRNMCVTMCRTLDPNAEAPKCSILGGGDYQADDWHSGWLIYLNPACDRVVTAEDPADPGNILHVQLAGNVRYGLSGRNGAPKSFTFSATGTSGLAGIGSFNLKDVEDNKTELNRTLCIDTLGRVRTISYSEKCS